MKPLLDSPFTFANPWLLLLLLALPLVAIFEGARGAAPAVIYSSLRPVMALGKPRRSRMGGLLLSLLLLALALLIVALARPRLGRTFTQVQASGIDIMLALDVSGSMIAEDMTIGGEQASRLDVVKQVTQKFIDERPNDRIGMMAFASRPYLVSPLTLDHGWLLQNLERVQPAPKFVEDGTAIGSGIAACTTRLIERKDSKSRIVVLLTDGENNTGKISPLTAAEAAKALGVKVYTIGIGTNGYAPFPQWDAFGRKYYGKIKADVDEVTLKKIADMTNAQFYRPTNTQMLKEIFQRIDQLEKSTVEMKQYTQYRELFPWLLGAGLGVLIVQGLLAQTVGEPAAMSFGQPLWFWGFAFLPLLIVLYARKESRRGKLLQRLVAARLVEKLAGTLSLSRRRLRFVLFLLGLAALLVSLAQPRYGSTWEQSKRKGRDIIIAIDCSKSMRATDLTPSRLGRAKLATQDLIEQLPGDRVGLIAFAGTAFLQAPLTIDYGAVLNSLAELDTDIIPRGGTNIAAAITEADAAFGKGESDNRCLILFTDGEELESDAVAAASAEKEHMRIFTVGLGSADGSLIPIPGPDGGTSFVKDEKGEIVKSRLDEDRLRKIAESTGGFYVHLQNGPAEMKQIVRDGLGQMKEKEIDARMSRRPIERYQWPLSAALVLLVASTLIGERKRTAPRKATPPPLPVRAVTVAALLLFLLPIVAQAKNSGVEAYEREDYKGAITEFDRQLQQQRDSAALNFDLGAAAYKMGDYAKALDAFAKAVTSPDPNLRAAAEYNLGNTLFQQGQQQQQKERRVQEWKDALQHYEQALKVTPNNKNAEYNRDVVRQLLEEKEPPKQDQQQQQKQDKKDDQKKDQQNQQQQQQQQGGKNDQKQDQKDQQQQQQQQQQSKGGQQQDQQQQQQQQSQSQSQQQQQQSQSQQSQGSQGQQQQPQNQQGNAQQEKDKDQNGKDGQQKQPQPQDGKDGKNGEKKHDKSPGSQGDQRQPAQPKDGQNQPPRPDSDEPGKKREGQIGAQGNAQSAEKSDDPQKEAAAEAEAAKEGKMTEAQAKALLESLKGDDKQVQLSKPDRKALTRNFRDW